MSPSLQSLFHPEPNVAISAVPAERPSPRTRRKSRHAHHSRAPARQFSSGAAGNRLQSDGGRSEFVRRANRDAWDGASTAHGPEMQRAMMPVPVPARKATQKSRSAGPSPPEKQARRAGPARAPCRVADMRSAAEEAGRAFARAPPATAEHQEAALAPTGAAQVQCCSSKRANQ
jgi:hypothetical protein